MDFTDIYNKISTGDVNWQIASFPSMTEEEFRKSLRNLLENNKIPDELEIDIPYLGTSVNHLIFVLTDLIDSVEDEYPMNWIDLWVTFDFDFRMIMRRFSHLCFDEIQWLTFHSLEQLVLQTDNFKNNIRHAAERLHDELST
ncbi:MAG: hypothetical protein LBN00_12165 [Oscillospiraceae bacterium]|jgi:hypothetical protein|nr:hypothetical protein [Oscillospiraceae bacterium]